MRVLLPAEKFIYEMFMESSVKVKKVDVKTPLPPKDFEIIKPNMRLLDE